MSEKTTDKIMDWLGVLFAAVAFILFVAFASGAAFGIWVISLDILRNP